MWRVLSPSPGWRGFRVNCDASGGTEAVAQLEGDLRGRGPMKLLAVGKALLACCLSEHDMPPAPRLLPQSGAANRILWLPVTATLLSGTRLQTRPKPRVFTASLQAKGQFICPLPPHPPSIASTPSTMSTWGIPSFSAHYPREVRLETIAPLWAAFQARWNRALES